MYKNVNQSGHCATLNMCNDIETNPGPPMYGIDPALTIKAPYSQGDIMYFLDHFLAIFVPFFLSHFLDHFLDHFFFGPFYWEEADH